MYGLKIRMVREMRGFSQENVAARLNISQSTYSGYETNQIKISAEMLEKVAEVLEVLPMDLMSSQPAIVNFQSNQGTQQAFGHVETFVSNQKELYEQMLTSKDEEIARLTKMVETLLSKK